LKQLNLWIGKITATFASIQGIDKEYKFKRAAPQMTSGFRRDGLVKETK
jgi:hypothetical protein